MSTSTRTWQQRRKKHKNRYLIRATSVMSRRKFDHSKRNWAHTRQTHADRSRRVFCVQGSFLSSSRKSSKHDREAKLLLATLLLSSCLLSSAFLTHPYLPHSHAFLLPNLLLLTAERQGVLPNVGTMRTRFPPQVHVHVAAVLLRTRCCAGLCDHRIRHRMPRLLADVQGKGRQCVLFAIACADFFKACKGKVCQAYRMRTVHTR